MPVDKEMYERISNELSGKAVLVAVSKTKMPEDILALYKEGQRDFGENYVQELIDKHAGLPDDIRWHFIGHLQTNKVKAIVPFVYLIHGVDSLRLLTAINKQAAKTGKIVDVLLQVHVAREETKFGLDAGELEQLMMMGLDERPNVRIRGLMGMASNTEDMEAVRAEFHALKVLQDKWFPESGILSMGMSGDYQLAVKEGSNMVRIGSLLFGNRG